MHIKFKQIVDIYEKRGILNDEAKLLFQELKDEDPNFNVSVAKRVIKDYLAGDSVELFDEEKEMYRRYQGFL